MAGADGFSGGTLSVWHDLDQGRVEARGFAFDSAESQLGIPVTLDPVYSCRSGLTLSQRKTLALSCGAAGVIGLFYPVLFAIGSAILLWAVFTMLIVWRLGLIAIGLVARGFRRKHVPPAPTEFPTYSILVAVYQETEIVDQLGRALNQLVWPADRLDVQILLEADDIETIAAVKAANFPAGTRLTIIPPGGVRTKSNALNYGLERAVGDYVCIYDAEDRPHPGQLLEAHRKFLSEPDEVACAQAPLIGDNQGEALIAAQWSLEYAIQFGLLLPAMAALRLPIAIGGTSNHFRIQALRDIGGWDAWNVTEDADLGLRFARFKCRVATLNLPTYEDAPTEFSVWAAQRSRWIKGFVQTWLVLMRHPGVLYRELGFARFVSLQLSLGGAVLAPIFHAPLMVLVLIAALSSEFSLGTFGVVLLGSGLTVGVLGDVLAPGPWHWSRLAAILTRPLYWPLHTISAVRALWELAVAPHFWAKTPHKPRRCVKGLSCSTGLSA